MNFMNIVAKDSIKEETSSQEGGEGRKSEIRESIKNKNKVEKYQD